MLQVKYSKHECVAPVIVDVCAGAASKSNATKITVNTGGSPGPLCVCVEQRTPLFGVRLYLGASRSLSTARGGKEGRRREQSTDSLMLTPLRRRWFRRVLETSPLGDHTTIVSQTLCNTRTHTQTHTHTHTHVACFLANL